MANLAPALEQTLKFEGGYVNNPADPGGETYRGVARKYFPNNPIWPVIDRLNDPVGTIKHGEIIGGDDGTTLDGLIADFYRVQFWDHIHGDDINSQSVAAYLFDWTVTSGNIGVLQVQSILGAATDGQVGTNTLTAINGADAQTLWNQMVAVRVQRAKDNVAHNPSHDEFLKGWLNRFEGFTFNDQ